MKDIKHEIIYFGLFALAGVVSACGMTLEYCIIRNKKGLSK